MKRPPSGKLKTPTKRKRTRYSQEDNDPIVTRSRPLPRRPKCVTALRSVSRRALPSALAKQPSNEAPGSKLPPYPRQARERRTKARRRKHAETIRSPMRSLSLMCSRRVRDLRTEANKPFSLSAGPSCEVCTAVHSIGSAAHDSTVSARNGACANACADAATRASAHGSSGSGSARAPFELSLKPRPVRRASALRSPTGKCG